MNAIENIITTRDLVDELAEKHDITMQAAREGVDTYLGQINEIDGTAWDTEMDADAAEAIRESFAAYYA